MGISRFDLSSPLRSIACAAALVSLIAGVTILIIRTFAHTLARNADTIQATEFAAAASPGDPLTRYRHAAYLERSFDLTAISRSLAEYETAAARSPHNFIYWLALGQARERDGDRPAAETAYRRALELAPHYSRTKWALGNNVVRQGRVDEGVALIRGAVDQDPAFAAPAVVAAMQAFDGDATRVSSVFRSNAVTSAEIAKYLVNEGRYDEAVAAWERVGDASLSGTLRDAGIAISAKLIQAKRYRDAVKVSGSIETDAAKRPLIGAISNGGFETGVKTQDADIFEWQIGQPYPLFGLSDSQPKEGRYSLLMRFKTPTRLDLATVSRTVAVEPGGEYELTLGYRADVNTRAEFRWEVVTADGNVRLAVSEPLTHSTGWTDILLRFKAPVDIDGIAVRLIRENCNSAACTVAGNLWFDDFKLRRN
jgi:cytochrome c-type biogenesis protein CcmH/NrfG